MKKIYVLALAAASLAAQTVSAHATTITGLINESGSDFAGLSLTQVDSSTYTATLSGYGNAFVTGFSNAGFISDFGTPYTVTESATVTPVSGSHALITNGTFTRTYTNLSEGAGTLFGTFSGSGDLKYFFGQPLVDWSANEVITGGTGVFAGFEGTGSLGGFVSFSGGIESFRDNATISAVPLPGSIAMFGSALVGLIGLGRRKAILNSAA